MKTLILFSCAVAVALGATIVDPEDCTEFPCLIFNDDFDYLDHDVWEHEITASGGGNWEFQAYLNNRSVSYVRDGSLYIKPGLTSEWMMDEGFITSGHLDLWGMNGRNDVCTGGLSYGCERVGNPDNIINPIISARLRTLQDFAFRYGRVEVVARGPSGAWLWPAIWLLPRNFPYGGWPASGEIDLFESRGNEDYGTLGCQYGATTLHWGPHFIYNRYYSTQAEYSPSEGTFADGLHKFAFDWTDEKMEFFVDDVHVLTVDPGTSFWDFGNYEGENIDNPWEGEGKMAPFNQKFYFVLNVAVGGTGGFFPDDVPSNPPKPWSNVSPVAMKDFYEKKDTWLPTWKHGEDRISEKAAMQIDSIKVYKMFNKEM